MITRITNIDLLKEKAHYILTNIQSCASMPVVGKTGPSGWEEDKLDRMEKQSNRPEANRLKSQMIVSLSDLKFRYCTRNRFSTDW